MSNPATLQEKYDDALETIKLLEQQLRRQDAAFERRIIELLEANSRFEQRGRMAEKFCRLLERSVLANVLRQTTLDSAIILVSEYRKDFPRGD